MKSIDHVESEPLTENVQETSGKRSSNVGKNHPDYWRDRIFKSAWQKGDEAGENWSYSVKIQHLSHRETVALHTANAVEASKRAAKIYLFLLSNGWDATRQKFKPRAEKAVATTLGAYLSAVSSVADKLRPSPNSVRVYAEKVRKIVSDILKLDLRKGKKYARASKGGSEWREKVEAYELAKLTDASIEKWKKEYIARRVAAGADADTADRSAACYIRNAASLFAEGILQHVKASVDLPATLPFATIAIPYGSDTPAYISTHSAAEILAWAKRELRESHPDAYAVLLLALCAGLRRSEIDRATWSWIDWNNGNIVPTAVLGFTGKTKGSLRPIGVDPMVLTEIESVVGPRKDGHIIDGHDLAKKRTYNGYRCDRHFSFLCRWLREKGLSSNRLVQSLRQEFGSAINHDHGLFAASRALRHTSVKTTAKHYLDSKGKVFIKTGSIFGEAFPEPATHHKQTCKPGEPADSSDPDICPI